MALHAEARAAVERIAALATTPELAEAIENASGDFGKQITAACTEFRAAIAGEMGVTLAELDALDADIADLKARGYGERKLVGFVWRKWQHTFDRDARLPEGTATAVVTKVRDIAKEWVQHVESIVASAPPSMAAAE